MNCHDFRLLTAPVTLAAPLGAAPRAIAAQPADRGLPRRRRVTLARRPMHGAKGLR